MTDLKKMTFNYCTQCGCVEDECCGKLAFPLSRVNQRIRETQIEQNRVSFRDELRWLESIECQNNSLLKKSLIERMNKVKEYLL